MSFSIGEGETRNNLFSLEKKMKAALFAPKETQAITAPRSNSFAHLGSYQQPITTTPKTSKCDMVVESSSNSSTFSIELDHKESNQTKPRSIKRHNSSLNNPGSNYFSSSQPHSSLTNEKSNEVVTSEI